MQNKDRTSSTSTVLDSTVAAQIGPRREGTVYDNASGLFEVLRVVTDTSEARRVMKRRAARFAVLVRDLHAGTEH